MKKKWDWPEIELEVFSTYSRAIAHLARQQSAANLSLMFGAGASVSVGIPTWGELVKRISADAKVVGADLFGTSDNDPLPTAAQVLFDKFRRDNAGHIANKHAAGEHPLLQKLIQSEWRRTIHECLYAKVPKTIDEVEEADKTYKHFVKIVRNSRITVTYNFDDTIERLILRNRSAEDESSGKKFSVLTDPRLPFRLREGNIFHVNGFLPYNELEDVGDGLVFAEGEFAKQLMETVRGANATLTHYLTKNTFLLIGLSLNDENLRHLLRLNAVLNPGHYHYRIHYINDRATFDNHKACDLANAHFENFNLITLFLDEAEIAALGQILARPLKDIREKALQKGHPISYVYYLTGVPGVGKTTSFKHFSSLVAHDEWLSERPAELQKPANELTEEEEEFVDGWIQDQVREKNRIIEDEKNVGVGISIVDRCPLDAITFTTDPDLWRTKAQELRTAIKTEGADRPVQNGHVILLVGKPEDVRLRALARSRQSGSTTEFIQWLQNATKLVYCGNGNPASGVSVIDIADLTIPQMLKEVADVIYRKDYIERDLDRLLRDYETGSGPTPSEHAPGGHRK